MEAGIDYTHKCEKCGEEIQNGLIPFIEHQNTCTSNNYVEVRLEDLEGLIDELSGYYETLPTAMEFTAYSISSYKSIVRMFGGYKNLMKEDVHIWISSDVSKFINRYYSIYEKYLMQDGNGYYLQPRRAR